MADFVSDDGSPLAMYLALPAGDAAHLVHRLGGDGASVLELGSGPGRTTRLLVALGHDVTAVDDSAEMLAHVTGAETVLADLWQLDVGSRFDVVLAASHLVNRPGAAHRIGLLGVCHRHVDDDGVVLVERYPPGWLSTAEPSTAVRGPVEIAFRPGARDGSIRSATVTYTLADRSWVQAFDAEDVDDVLLADAAGAVGLRVDTTLDDGRWVALRRC